MEADRTSREATGEVVEEKVYIFTFGSCVVEMLDTRIRNNPIAPIAADASLVSEAERRHPEICGSPGAPSKLRLGGSFLGNT
jgi:hypothetical protein